MKLRKGRMLLRVAFAFGALALISGALYVLQQEEVTSATELREEVYKTGYTTLEDIVARSPLASLHPEVNPNDRPLDRAWVIAEYPFNAKDGLDNVRKIKAMVDPLAYDIAKNYSFPSDYWQRTFVVIEVNSTSTSQGTLLTVFLFRKQFRPSFSATNQKALIEDLIKSENYYWSSTIRDYISTIPE